MSLAADITKSEHPIILEPSYGSDLPSTDFGEGLSPRSEDEFVVLTWQERNIYTVLKSTMQILTEESLPLEIREGWGVTADESQVNENGYYQLYISDGSSYIYLVDGESLEVTGSIRVYDADDKSFIDNLNELEYANGYLYANIWMT